MANHVSHAALPYPIKGCRYTIWVPYLDADGDPTDPTTPDTERSIDAAAFADCTEEVTTISGSNGTGYLTLTGDETNGSMIAVAAKVASGPKATLAMLAPRVLPVLYSGTATAGAASTITLSATTPPPVDDMIIGCIIRTTGGTGGGGGSGSLGNQARVITDYVASTRVVTVSPNWETNPASGTTYEIMVTEMSFVSMADLRLIDGAVLATHATGHQPADVRNLEGAALDTHDAGSFPADLRSWMGLTPNSLVGGNVPSLTTIQTGNTLDAGSASTAQLAAGSSSVTDFYKGCWIFLGSGTGALQCRLITAYDGSTKVATVAPDWATSPTVGTGYAIMAMGPVDTELWRNSVPNVLISGKIDANAQTVGDKTGYSLASPVRIQKNTALAAFGFVMYDSAGSPTAGLTITATRSLDGAAFAACANSATGIANGVYKIDLAATDLNADVVVLRFTASGAVDTLISIVTQSG